MTSAHKKLCIFVTHPVQYHVPLWRGLASQPALDVKVFYFNDQSVRGGLDKEFGVKVAWDVDLLSGYEHTFLARDTPLDNPRAAQISDPDELLAQEAPNWILISGYTHSFERQLVRAARRHHSKILMRGEFSDLSFGKRSLAKRAARAAYLRWFYAHVDRFCFPGEGARRHLQRHGVQPQQMFFSPYSVDDSLIEAQKRSTSREQARDQLGIASDCFVFILSGKLIERKNPFAVLEALRKVHDLSRVVLIALGDGEMREAFTNAARELLGTRFIFPGFVNQTQLGRYFLSGDVLVMPSHHETWGLVVNEAMHYGLPSIVSSQVGCAPDLVLPNSTGLVYEAGRIDEFARHMQAMIDDRAQTALMGVEAARHIERYRVAASRDGVLRALELRPAP